MAVNNQAAQNLDGERFNFRKLNELEFRTQYQIKFSNWYAALENLSDKWFNDVRQTETHTAEPLVPEPSAFEVELANGKLKSHKSPGNDQIPADLWRGVEQFAVRSINLLFLL